MTDTHDLWHQTEEEGSGFHPAEYYDLCRLMGGDPEKIRKERSNIIRSMMEKNPVLSAENAAYILSGYSLMDFLHGDCNIFAQHLHERYKYEMEAVYLDDGYGGKQLVHMYCIGQDGKGRNIYIDCRGKCGDFLTLMQEFEDAGLWSSDEPYIIKRYKRMPSSQRTAEQDTWRLHFAKLADESLGWYAP